MQSALKLSVVMATYRRAETLRETIQHLERQDLSPDQFEVIIIDDASPDETPEVVREAQARVRFGLKFLRNDTNRGPGHTENRGIREASAPLVLLMADDIWMAPCTLRMHVEAHERHPEPEVAVMGRVLQSPRLNQSLFLRNWDPFQFAKLGPVAELPYYRFWANNISINREFLMKHGMFRENMGRAGAAAHEDAEMGYRLHKAGGLRIIYEPRALGDHYHYMTLDGAIKRWYERGLNYGVLEEHVPEPEVPVFYHVLNRHTFRDHLRAILGPRRCYVQPRDRNLLLLLVQHAVRLVAFNSLTVPYVWQPLLKRAETSPALARLAKTQIYRLFLYYYFLKGVYDADHRYGASDGGLHATGETQIQTIRQ